MSDELLLGYRYISKKECQFVTRCSIPVGFASKCSIFKLQENGVTNSKSLHCQFGESKFNCFFLKLVILNLESHFPLKYHDQTDFDSQILK